MTEVSDVFLSVALGKDTVDQYGYHHRVINYRDGGRLTLTQPFTDIDKYRREIHHRLDVVLDDLAEKIALGQKQKQQARNDGS